MHFHGNLSLVQISLKCFPKPRPVWQEVTIGEDNGSAPKPAMNYMNQSWYSHISRVSCKKGLTRHAYAWQIGPFWQDTIDMYATWTLIIINMDYNGPVSPIPERNTSPNVNMETIVWPKYECLQPPVLGKIGRHFFRKWVRQTQYKAKFWIVQKTKLHWNTYPCVWRTFDMPHNLQICVGFIRTHKSGLALTTIKFGTH